MLRLIIQTMPQGEDYEPDGEPTFAVYEFDCEEMEKHLQSPVPAKHKRTILGYQVFEKAKEVKAEEKKEEKKVNPDLLKRLEEMRKKNSSNGGDKSKFAKWEEKAKKAKLVEAQKAKGYPKRTWWGGRINGATS